MQIYARYPCFWRGGVAIADISHARTHARIFAFSNVRAHQLRGGEFLFGKTYTRLDTTKGRS